MYTLIHLIIHITHPQSLCFVFFETVWRISRHSYLEWSKTVFLWHLSSQIWSHPAGTPGLIQQVHRPQTSGLIQQVQRPQALFQAHLRGACASIARVLGLLNIRPFFSRIKSETCSCAKGFITLLNSSRGKSWPLWGLEVEKYSLFRLRFHRSLQRCCSM